MSYQFYVIPICAILTLLSSVVCLASKSTASRLYNEATQGGTLTSLVMLQTELPNQLEIETYPSYLGLSARTLILVASSFSLLGSTAVAAISARVMLKHKPVKLPLYFKQALLFFLFANVSLALAAFITSFVLHSKSAQFSLSYHKLEGDASGAYEFDFENHIFDLETWTCSVKNLPSFRGVSTISQQLSSGSKRQVEGLEQELVTIQSENGTHESASTGSPQLHPKDMNNSSTVSPHSNASIRSTREVLKKSECSVSKAFKELDECFEQFSQLSDKFNRLSRENCRLKAENQRLKSENHRLRAEKLRLAAEMHDLSTVAVEQSVCRHRDCVGPRMRQVAGQWEM